MDGRLARLTEAQRVALRMFMARKTAKEIALELGITPKAVELRLKGAREALGVSSSAEAARLLAAAEQEITYRETPGYPTEVAPADGIAPLPAVGRNDAEADGRKVVGEARAAFIHEPIQWPQDFEWPLRSKGRKRNELSLTARLLWPFVAIFGIGVSIGTIVICGAVLALAGTAIFRLFH